MKILHSETQLAVSIEHERSNLGDDHKEIIIFRYEGDNLAPGKSSLVGLDFSVPGEQSRLLARQGNPRLQTLSLILKAPCAVWYPRGVGGGMSSLSICPPGLLSLAKTVETRIVFDTKWLGKNISNLQSALQSSRQLTGIGVSPEFTRLYQRADWSILCFAPNGVSEPYPSDEGTASQIVRSIEVEAPDAPPPYVRETGKRSLANRPSLTPELHPFKRVFQCPPFADSSKEHGTSATTDSQSTASSTGTVEVDLFQDAVTLAVHKVLPSMLSTHLPSILQDLVPKMLSQSSPSPSSSPTLRPKQTASSPKRDSVGNNKLATDFRAILSGYTEKHIEEMFATAAEEVAGQVSELHESAALELDECVNDARLSLAVMEEEHIAAFVENCNRRVEDFEAHLADCQDASESRVEAHCDDAISRAEKRLDMAMRKVCDHAYCRMGKQRGWRLRRAISEPDQRSRRTLSES